MNIIRASDLPQTKILIIIYTVTTYHFCKIIRVIINQYLLEVEGELQNVNANIILYPLVNYWVLLSKEH